MPFQKKSIPRAIALISLLITCLVSFVILFSDRKSELSVYVQNSTHSEVAIHKVTIGAAESIVEKRSIPKDGFSDANRFTVKNDRRSNVLVMTINDGILLRCEISGKSYFDFCALKVNIESLKKITCACDTYQ